jgi:hypothetical protein
VASGPNPDPVLIPNLDQGSNLDPSAKPDPVANPDLVANPDPVVNLDPEDTDPVAKSV